MAKDKSNIVREENLNKLKNKELNADFIRIVNELEVFVNDAVLNFPYMSIKKVGISELNYCILYFKGNDYDLEKAINEVEMLAEFSELKVIVPEYPGYSVMQKNCNVTAEGIILTF